MDLNYTKDFEYDIVIAETYDEAFLKCAHSNKSFTMKPFNMDVVYSDELISWLNKKIGINNYSFKTGYVIGFKTSDDALYFKEVWLNGTGSYQNTF